MIKPRIDSYCTEKGEIIAKCPHCNAEGKKQVFESDTALYINSIQLKKIHNKFFALCTQCKNTFELNYENISCDN